MEKKIKVIIKAPGMKPYEASIEATEGNIGKIIGGDWRVLRYAGDACVICAKDQTAFDYNCEWCQKDFYGPIIWIGYSEKGFRPFPDEFSEFKKLNYSLFDDYERYEKKKIKVIGEICLLLLSVGLWGWIGYEFARQICELL